MEVSSPLTTECLHKLPTAMDHVQDHSCSVLIILKVTWRLHKITSTSNLVWVNWHAPLYLAYNPEMRPLSDIKISCPVTYISLGINDIIGEQSEHLHNIAISVYLVYRNRKKEVLTLLANYINSCWHAIEGQVVQSKALTDMFHPQLSRPPFFQGIGLESMNMNAQYKGDTK